MFLLLILCLFIIFVAQKGDDKGINKFVVQTSFKIKYKPKGDLIKNDEAFLLDSDGKFIN